MEWYAINTKYKAEKWVAERLAKKGVHAYVPLLIKKKKYKKRIATYHYPIISCYCFVQIDLNQKSKVLSTEHVIGFVGNKGKAHSIKEEEINILKKVTGEIQNVHCSISENHLGMPVEIIAGNLCGLKGRLVNIQGKKEFIVELESLGYQLQLSVSPDHLNLLRKDLVA